MKGLSNLIRLHKWQLEEERKALAALLSARQDLEDRAAKIRADMASERQKANNINWLFAYPPYAEAANKQLDRLAESVTELEVTIAAAEDRVADAFKELKKYEVALERQLERERIEAERREQILLDEIALNAHRRKVG
jgi:flagellar export protein FliJ